MKRSKIDRLFRLWDCLNLLRDLGILGMSVVGTPHDHNMEARKKLRKLISEEYGVPNRLLAKNQLTIGGCIHLIRERR